MIYPFYWEILQLTNNLWLFQTIQDKIYIWTFVTQNLHMFMSSIINNNYWNNDDFCSCPIIFTIYNWRSSHQRRHSNLKFKKLLRHFIFCLNLDLNSLLRSSRQGQRNLAIIIISISGKKWECICDPGLSKNKMESIL